LRTALASLPKIRLDQEREHAADRDAVHPFHETHLDPDHDGVLGERDELLLTRSNASGGGVGFAFKRAIDHLLRTAVLRRF
jgi:hypothetical protein